MRSIGYVICIIMLMELFASCDNDVVESVKHYQEVESVYPDYRDVTVPATIAPLNFSYLVDVPGNTKTVFSFEDYSIVVRGRKVHIDNRKWHKLLSMAKGNSIKVYSEALQTQWNIYVSDDEIDYGLNYRLIEPSYEKYSNMGIYERSLSNFRQTSLLRNTEFAGCCNCHSHLKGDPSNMSMHIRGDQGCTLIMKDGKLDAYKSDTDSTLSKCVYTYWHPSGKYIAYSNSLSAQQFFVTDNQVLEVVDKDGDVVIYDIDGNQLILSPELMKKQYTESFPSFSPDGKTLYFTRYDRIATGTRIPSVKYVLCRIDFNPETGIVGDQVSVLIDTCDINDGSVCFPKPSPDGRYIMFTRSDYGGFASWHHEADLWLYDLSNGNLRPLDEVNSKDSEGCHCWSTNGRWFAFGSRRDDGLYTRVYISHFDPETGKCGKPFMLPQLDPEVYYSGLFFSYNIPEFVTGPKVFDRKEARTLIEKGRKEDSSIGRIPFGLRRQGEIEEFDAVTGSTILSSNSVSSTE